MMLLEPFISSALFFMGMLTLIIYIFELHLLSRVIIFGSLAIFLLLEMYLLSGFFFTIFNGRQISLKRKSLFSLFILELLLISTSFFTIHYFKMGTFLIKEEYRQVLLFIYFVWAFTSLIIHKFQIRPAGQ